VYRSNRLTSRDEVAIPIVHHLAVRLRLRFRGEVVAYLLRAFRKESRQVWAPEAPGDPHLMLVAAITARITSAGIAHGRPLRVAHKAGSRSTAK
jgi:hypothetical protein